MKKVGVVSCYFKNNYGSMLQAYALNKFLNDKNIYNETIKVDDNIDFKKGKKRYYLKQIFNFKFIKAKFGMIKLRLNKILNKKLNSNIAIRNKKFTEFKTMYFNLSPSFATYEELANYSKDEFSNIIVGSDQLWLPVNVEAGYYTLNWVPKNINKLSYATSFGVSTIPNKYKVKYVEFLKNIDNISVREEEGVKLVNTLVLRKAELVCDPTLLLTKEEWLNSFKQERTIKDDYILCYFLGNNVEFYKFAEKLRDKTGLKIVSLNHLDEYIKYADKYADFTPYNIGPIEFINLINNANYVCTDSFHGTVFSLIFNKPFFTFRRYKNSSQVSTNSRIYSLLSIVNLKDRLLNGNEDITKVLNMEIDFNLVNNKIKEFREKSKKWLLDSLIYKNYVSINSNDCDEDVENMKD